MRGSAAHEHRELSDGGALAAVSALMLALQQKGTLTADEMGKALADAEGALAADANRPERIDIRFRHQLAR